MNNAEYWHLIRRTFQPDCDDGVLYCMVGIAGEAGEIANMAQKGMRGDFMPFRLRMPEMADDADEAVQHLKKRKQLIEEMGGVFYFLHALCYELGTTPEEVMAINTEKLRGRLARDMIRGDGDDR